MRNPLVLPRILFLGTIFLVRGITVSAAAPLNSQAAGGGRNHAEAALEARNKLLSAADSYEGTPYRYGGLDRNGLDCSGFIYASFKDSLAVSVPRTSSALYTWVEKIDDHTLQPGDLVFFITTGRGISHAGIYTGEGRFIHCASDGPKTGVMYSRLDESYWQKTFAGAGRALPEGPLGDTPAAGTGGGYRTTPSPVAAGAKESAPPKNRAAARPASPGGEGWNKIKGKGFMVGFAFAPSWSGFMERNNPLRGFAAQGRIAWQGPVFGQTLVPGFEIRPEWDDALGVFRMPFTLSLGFDDKLRVFAGPAFSLGDPKLNIGTGNRPYAGGTSWFGAAGVTVAPFSFPVHTGRLDLYGELAWQSYYGAPGTEPNWNADMSAGIRFSTGVRYTWDI
jgi:probable lipoprotein NlpC